MRLLLARAPTIGLFLLLQGLAYGQEQTTTTATLRVAVQEEHNKGWLADLGLGGNHHHNKDEGKKNRGQEDGDEEDNNSSTEQAGAQQESHHRDDAMDYAGFIRGHGVHNGDQDPVCTMQNELSRKDMLCPMVAGWLSMTQLFPFRLGSVRKVRQPQNNKKDLPKPLAALTPIPVHIPQDTAKDERLTYYFYYRLILNVYEQAYHHKKGLLDPPEGWQNSEAYVTKDEDGLPLAQSFVKDDTLLVAVRGTVTRREWEQDFKYYWADVDKSSKYFDGRVHDGFFSMFINLREAFEADITKSKAKVVTVVGHSLGGSVANLLAYHAAKYKPDLKVEVVTFGAPSVGCPTFAKAFGGLVNSRQVKFSGKGNRGDEKNYEVGDFIGGVACGSLEACPLLSTFDTDKEGEKYEYGVLPGIHAFYSDNLKNGDTWKMKNDRMSLLFDPVSCHVCSYLCYTAQGSGDRDDRCYFLLDLTTSTPLKYRCSALM